MITKAVSYTHLDVYKRQVWLNNITATSAVRYITKHERDVYKRQVIFCVSACVFGFLTYGYVSPSMCIILFSTIIESNSRILTLRFRAILLETATYFIYNKSVIFKNFIKRYLIL